MNGRLGRYVLLSRLGAGGTAEVWRARLDGPHGFERDVVLKRLRPDLALDRGFVARLRSEARLLALLDHANVAQVYELFEASGETVLVMEHVLGCDLLELLRAHAHLGTRMPVGMAAYVAREVARGLAAAHAHRDVRGTPTPIVHRDVNPANIMLGTDGIVRLIDFGFAKAAEERSREQTATGVLFGKLGYVAPEQLADVGRRREPDPRCDQFSLGVVLHEMLTGRRLVRPGSSGEPQDVAASARPLAEPPSRTNPEVSPALDLICQRMLSIDPAARYDDCRTVAEMLDEVARDAHFGSTQMSAHLAALDRPRATNPSPGDANRETEDAGAGVFGDTVVDLRSGDAGDTIVERGRAPAAARPRGRHGRTGALCAVAVVLALLIGIESRRHRAPVAAPPAAPAALSRADAEPPAAPRIAAAPARPRVRSIATSKPAERRAAPAHRMSHHEAAPPPTPPRPAPSFDGRVQDGTIYDPFK